MGSRTQYDIAIVGGGLVGLSLAVALEESGLRLALVEPRLAPALSQDGWDSRVYALSPGSAAFLERTGTLNDFPGERITRVEGMEIFGDNGAARLSFSAYDSGLRELAFIVENRLLQHVLCRAMQSGATRVYCPAACASLQFGREEVT